ncbi:class I SAM-dependent methyltransferase [Curtobacterium ammoniigenes]|uniref:class I SAM-dependent methyltransferase n=1 Tax=Curtobacterium ammoniigenes TaxID=395387 RepID=UPI0008369911|nr:class I SAM-dependent methyltransferase [Curtobacterium ammoniigenes]
MHDFDAAGWDRHWTDARGDELREPVEPNPRLVDVVASLPVGTVLDAGCGTGTEAIWLAQQGWRVTAVDLSNAAIDVARTREAQTAREDSALPPGERARARQAPVPVDWNVADLTVWEPSSSFDLVASHYAHATIPQLELYARIADWVRPGGSLLIVGHGAGGRHSHGGEPPADAIVRLEGMRGVLDPAEWRSEVTAESRWIERDGERITLHDIVLRGTRLATPSSDPLDGPARSSVGLLGESGRSRD